ncbi:MAG: hypothetical protein U9Q77_10520 [Candidatus Marinimicrobia bacterium]|nr:hypothetical protein [Candidatus Neomarinimicrobiota bacterium]
MRRILVSMIMVVAILLLTTQLFAALNGIKGKCTLPAESGISIEITRPEDFSTTTGTNGDYSINMSGASAGTYYFHATNGVGHHYWSWYVTGASMVVHNFALGV